MIKKFLTVSSLLEKQRPADVPAAGEQKSTTEATAETAPLDPEVEVFTEDEISNVTERIDKGINLSADIAKEAAEKIAKTNKERRVEETVSCLNRGAYTQEKLRLDIRRERAITKARKKKIQAVNNLVNETNLGKHDTTSWNEAYKKIDEICSKAITAADTDYRTYEQKLRQLYPSYYRHEWDYCW